MRRRRTGLLALLLLLSGSRAGALTAAEERQLGRQFELRTRATLPHLDDVEVRQYVNRLGRRITTKLADNPFDYRFFVLSDARINAFAVPGGAIYINAGLLMSAASDDEVAGVLAHEVAHVNNHHLSRQQDATKALNYATLVGALLSVVQPAIGAGAAAINAATQLQYRREFEQEADYAGARYVQTAGFAPRGMLTFFKKMLAQQGSAAAQTAYLLTHPLTEVRLNNLEAALRAQKWDTLAPGDLGPDLATAQMLVRVRVETAPAVLERYRAEASRQPNAVLPQYLLGRALFELGMYDDALVVFEALRTANFDGSERERGRTLLRLQRMAEARPLLHAWTETNPEDSVAHADLAKLLAAHGDTEAALTEYRRAVHITPDFEAAHYELGQLAGRNGHAADGHYHLGIALLCRGELDKAALQLEKAIPLLPTNDPRRSEIHDVLTELAPQLGRAVPTP